MRLIGRVERGRAITRTINTTFRSAVRRALSVEETDAGSERRVDKGRQRHLGGDVELQFAVGDTRYVKQLVD